MPSYFLTESSANMMYCAMNKNKKGNGIKCKRDLLISFFKILPVHHLYCFRMNSVLSQHLYTSTNSFKNVGMSLLIKNKPFTK